MLYFASVRAAGKRRQKGHARAAVLIMLPGLLRPYQLFRQPVHILWRQPRRPQAGLRSLGWKVEKHREHSVRAVCLLATIVRSFEIRESVL